MSQVEALPAGESPGSGMVLLADETAAAMEGRLVSGAQGRRLGGFSIDSRTLAPGDLFFAIRGDRFDGHAFVGDAVARGGCGVVVSEASAVPAGTDVAILVDDTTRALQRLARYVRRRSGAVVVAITGSAGKTTTKEIIAALLAARYRVFRNVGNLNNHIGLPLSLLGLRAKPEIAVVELGMSHAGEIRTLVGIAEPEVRVWTNVGPVHQAFFSSVDAIADAKAEIFEGASRTSLLVANADDPRVMARVPRFEGRVRTFAIDQPADVRASNIEDLGIEGTRARVSTPAGEVAVTTALIGRGNLANALAATSVAVERGISLHEIADRLAGVRPASRRGEIWRLGRGVVVIDDSYNSNPTALQRVLEVVARERTAGRRVAVLGEMLELGEASASLHEACGRAAVAAGVTLLLTVGGTAVRALGEGAAAAGLPSAAVVHFDTSEAAAARIGELVAPGDLVLVKGSRGIRTDVVVDRLKAELA